MKGEKPMAILGENMTLDESKKASKKMNDVMFFWIIKENVLELEIPKNCFFDCLGVIWDNIDNNCMVAAIFPHEKNNVKDSIIAFKGDEILTIDFNELREQYQKLFEIKGVFGTIN